MQNEITSRLANQLGAELIAAEAARPTEHSDALDYILRGRLEHRASRLRQPVLEEVLATELDGVEAQFAGDEREEGPV